MATPVADWVIVLPIVLAMLGSAVLLMMRRARQFDFAFAVLVVLAIMACEVGLLLDVYANGPASMTMGRWLPPFGISLTVDLFGASFALIASAVTLIVLIYAEAARREDVTREGFLPLVLLLLAGVTGSFLTGDLFNLYVWFEVLLIASFGLIVTGGRPIQLDAALKYGFLNFLATTLFLLALGLLYGLLGTLNMADVLRVAPLANPAAMTGVALLLVLAFGMKAAAFPVNAWLPASYHAPPAAISALFAGLLTKVGVYALMRSLVLVLPASRDLLEPLLVALAVATLVLAPLGAIAETNLRRALGFLVIGGIGSVIAGLALGTGGGISGAAFYIVHSMLTMTALYLLAGLIERRSGQTDSRHMGGLYSASAPLSIMFLVLILGAAGIPPLLGFWPKLLLLEASLLDGGWIGGALAGALLVNAFLTLIAGSRLWAHIFWRDATAAMRVEQATNLQSRYAAVILLTVLIGAAGLWPNPLFAIARAGAEGIIDPSRYVTAVGLAGDSP